MITQIIHKIKPNRGQALRRCAGQAATEMAIFGSLILLCFSVLLTYGQRLDNQQRVKMETFRKALQRAYDRNSGVSYTAEEDVRTYNSLGVFGQDQESGASSSASVMWQKGAAGLWQTTGDSSFAFYQINDEMIGDPDTGLPRHEKDIITPTGDDDTVQAPESVWRVTNRKFTRHNANAMKNERLSGNILQRHEVLLSAQVRRTVHTRFDDSVTDARERFNEPEYVYYAPTGPYTQGAFYNRDNNRIEYSRNHVGTEIRKFRQWYTRY